MYEWVELIRLWEREQLTTEQVIGQLLRHGQTDAGAYVATQRQMETLAQALAALTARVTALEASQGKRNAA
ncbi:MAG: hypothetical protein U0350_28740 [Caldilineaceae bacterium]